MRKQGHALTPQRARALGSALAIVEPLMLLLCPVVLILCAVLRVESTVLMTTFVALFSFVPFVLRFELRRPQPADIMPIAVLSAAAIVGRIAFAAIPNAQPVSAIVIFAGIWFGRQSGYLTGAFTALVSNMVLGQGMWTPWQMYAWGLMGFLAGVFFSRDAAAGFQSRARRILVYSFGAVASILFGIVMDVWYIIGFLQDLSPGAVMAAFGAGATLNILHVACTVVFLRLMLVPWGKKIRRIQTKYKSASSRR
jgi:energy-coupling factor transport system substrate-specific component